MSQNLDVQGARARRMIPIIPAIPRCLERKPKQASMQQQSSEKVNEKPEAAVATEIQQDVTDVASAVSALEVQDEDLNDGREQDDGDMSVKETIEKKPEGREFSGWDSCGQRLTCIEDSVRSPSTIQDFGIERHGFKLPPPFYPRTAPPAPVSATSAVTDLTANTGEPTPQDPVADYGNVEEVRVKHHALRAEASSFHAHPNPSDANLGLFKESHSNGLVPAQHQSFTSQPTPPTDATTSPVHSNGAVRSNGAVHSVGQGYGHAHNISFFPPPPLSPNNASSPAHSVYQGYTYAPVPNTYSSHTYSASQHSQSYQPYSEGYTSPVHPYGPRSPYTNGNPPFATLGSQPPLTPSATPLEAHTQQWDLPNGHTMSRPHRASNATFQHPENFQQYRSASPSTLQSDSASTMPFKVVTTSTQPLTYDADRPNNWQSVELNAMQKARMNGALDEAPLAEHLLYHFNDPEYADCWLIIIHGSKRFVPREWAVSSLLLAQSRRLRDLLKISKQGSDGKRVLELNLTDRFVTPESIESALRVLYGLPPGHFDVPRHGEALTARLSRIQMQQSLAYAATGCLLHLKDVVLRGLQVASEVLSWDNLESALSFGLESGLEREFNASAAVIPAYSTLLTRDSDPSPSNNTLSTPGSSDDSAVKQPSHSPKSESKPEVYLRPPPRTAHDLLSQCLDFMTENFPASWELDPSARPLADVDRLPVTAESRSPLSKSRLSRIQFGSFPSEADVKADDRNVLLSTILLSLPFVWLQHLLQNVGEPIARSISSIIKERERRRHIILQSKSVPWTERIAAKDYAWFHAGYEEFVRANDDGELSISRKYTGIALDTQDKSPTER